MTNTQKIFILARHIIVSAFRVVVLTTLFISLLNHQSVHAQESGQGNETKKIIQLSREQLKSFEGYFQNGQNKDMVVQFTAMENSLQAKLLWNDGQLLLFPNAALEFFSKDGEPVTIQFIRGQNGSIVQFRLRNNGLWERIYGYKPLVHIEFPHTPDQLKIFEGIYQYEQDDSRFIQFTEKDNKLVLKQHWDGEQLQFVPDSALSFFSREAKLFTLQFVKDAEGNIVQAIAFKKDVWNKLKKFHPVSEQLKALEGKYQFKDDKDDFLQIKAQGENLVVKQLWDGKETVVSPRSETYFYNDEQSYPIKFKKNKDGVIAEAIVLDGDLFEKIKE